MRHYAHRSAPPQAPPKVLVLDPRARLDKAKLRPLASDQAAAPVTIPDSVGDFKLLTSFTVPHAPNIRVAKYMSSKTGLKVIWAGTPGPFVNGLFTVPTEIWDNSGCPHTLEHLSFCGSHDFPFKGTVDSICSRLYGNMNAFTEVTNTSYECTFGSGQGFLDTLPLYLDAVLYPTLTQEAFDTEVHCVNGRGEDTGVVFSEMQGRQALIDDLVDRRLAELLYNENNANRSETGGELGPLRELKLKQIKDFHKYAYRPQNLTVTAIGSAITPTQLLEQLSNTTEKSIAEHGDAQGPRPAGWKRPWVESKTAQNAPKITHSERETVLFPASSRSTPGRLDVKFVGPAATDLGSLEGVSVLCAYLTTAPFGPLYKAAIARPNPPCTSLIHSIDDSRSNPVILSLSATRVAPKRMDELSRTIDRTLAAVAEHGIDLGMMKHVIEQAIDSSHSDIENHPSDTINDKVMRDVLYGSEDGRTLKRAFDDLARLKDLLKWSSEDWTALLKKYLLAPSITLCSTASPSLAKKNAADEEAIVASNKAKLGPKGLRSQAERLAASERKNAVRAPDSVIDRFKVPDAGSIDWISVETARSSGGQRADAPFVGAVQSHVDADGELPLFVQFSHTPSSHFIKVTTFLYHDLESSDLGLLELLPVLVDAFLALPMTLRKGKLTAEEVTARLARDCTDVSVSQERESIKLSLTVLAGEYERAISWLNALLFCTTFTRKQLLRSAKRMLERGFQFDGDEIGFMSTSRHSISYAFNSIERNNMLQCVLAKLHLEPWAVTRDFERLRAGITNPCAMRISVQGDIQQIRNPIQAWKDYFSLDAIQRASESALIPVAHTLDHRSKLGRKPALDMRVLSDSSGQSSYATIFARGPPGWKDPDDGPLRVACAILNALTGDLSISGVVRGAGLGYGAGVYLTPELKQIQLSFWDSPDGVLALKAIRKLVRRIASGKVAITDDALQAGISQTVVDSITANGATPGQAAEISAFRLITGEEPADVGRRQVAAARKVTADDVRRAIERWVVPLFDPETSAGAIMTGTAQKSAIVAEMKRLGYEVRDPGFDERYLLRFAGQFLGKRVMI